MRLIHKHRNRRPKTPRIPISQEEIAADLHYPSRRLAREVAAAERPKFR